MLYRRIWLINTIKADSTADIFMELLRAIITAIIFMLHVCPARMSEPQFHYGGMEIEYLLYGNHSLNIEK